MALAVEESKEGLVLKIYFAGNFPLMKNPELEKKFRDKVLESEPEYRRLLSFYYKKDIQNLISMKKEEG